MSQTKEIRSKISSIKNTQKITRAMELVAASKMRKAQDRMTASKPYSEKIRAVIKHVSGSSSEYHHPYLIGRDTITQVGYIVVSSDRGLCGGLNVNCFKAALKSMKQWDDRGIGIDLCLIGHKAENFFKYHGGNVIASTSHLGDAPKVSELIGVIKVMLDKYDNGEIDAIYIVSNEFINTMKQNAAVKPLLPLTSINEDATSNTNHATSATHQHTNNKKSHWDYIYEPDDANILLDMLLRRYIESQVYQAVIENIACFMAAQMVAMKSATENASELIDELQLVYNKARQASITQEIAEIVAGAEAIN